MPPALLFGNRRRWSRSAVRSGFSVEHPAHQYPLPAHRGTGQSSHLEEQAAENPDNSVPTPIWILSAGKHPGVVRVHPVTDP